MFHRIWTYELVGMNSRWYRPRAYGDPQPDGTWDGWLVFFLLGSRSAVASARETTQSSLEALTIWASRLTPVYLESALARALSLAQQSSLIARLADAEYEALEDAERFNTAADVDDLAAAEARTDAEQIRSQRHAAEDALATAEELAATKTAALHEEAARSARELAANAARRRGRAQATRAKQATKPRTSKKK
jgi:hypothetical protein